MRTDGVHCRESAGTGPVNLKVISSKRVLTWQVTIDQLICSPFSHTHYYWHRRAGRQGFRQKTFTRTLLHSQLDRRTQLLQLLLLQNTQIPFESIQTVLRACV